MRRLGSVLFLVLSFCNAGQDDPQPPRVHLVQPFREDLLERCDELPTIRNNTCPITVRPIPNSSLSYQFRGDRCEGRFGQPIGFGEYGGLGLLGYSTDLKEAAEGGWRTGLNLSWPNPASQSVWLQARMIAATEYYRMDKVVDASKGIDSWRSTVLPSLGSKAPIALRARSPFPLAYGTRCLYLPITAIAQRKSTSTSKHFILTFVSEFPLDGLTIEVLEQDKDGKETSRFRTASSNLLGAWTAITFGLPECLSTGYYRVTAIGKSKGQVMQRSFLIYYG